MTPALLVPTLLPILTGGIIFFRQGISDRKTLPPFHHVQNKGASRFSLSISWRRLPNIAGEGRFETITIPTTISITIAAFEQIYFAVRAWISQASYRTMKKLFFPQPQISHMKHRHHLRTSFSLSWKQQHVPIQLVKCIQT